MSQTDGEREQALSFIARIASKAATGKYLFRGENIDHDEPVKSSLYREYEGLPALERLGIAFIQEVETSVARQHSPNLAPDHNLLHLLQHHRGRTNLIDFSEDFLIALFFACDGEPDQDGRIILLDRAAHRNHTDKPTQPPNRVIAQKSVFVEPPDGYLEWHEFEAITVPGNLKIPLLEILRASHGISGSVIYNDLHGYVTRRELTTQTLHIVAEAAECQEAGDYGQAMAKYAEAIRLSPENPTPYRFRAMMRHHLGELHEAIADNTEALQLDPGLKMAYHNRGTVYAEQGEHELALADYDEAIRLDPQFAHAYNSRGATHMRTGDTQQAVRDFDRAIRNDPELAIAYCNRGQASIELEGSWWATKYLDQAIALDPTLAVAYYNRGLLRRRDHQPGAESDLREALRLDPTLPPVDPPLETDG